MIIRREDFGDVSELTKGSSKKLWVTCDDCGVGLLRSNKVVKKRDIDLCISCQNSRTAKDPKVLEKRRKVAKKNWNNPEYRTKVCPKISKKKKEWWGNKEEKDKVSKNKTPYEELKLEIEEIGYKLITTKEEWENKTNIYPFVKCEKHGNIFRYRKGHYCAYCSGRKIYIPDVIKECEDMGYDFISIEGKYINFICNNGHRNKITYGNWRAGSRCLYCVSRKMIHKDEMKRVIEEKGFEIVNEPIEFNTKTELKIRCKKCRELYTTHYTFFLERKSCTFCDYIEKYYKIKEMIESEGYIFLNNIGDKLQKMYFICPNGHEHYMTIGNWGEGQRCGLCYWDRVEQEVEERLKSLSGKLLYFELVRLWTNRSIRYYMEIFNPKGIELNWDNTIDHMYSRYYGFVNKIPPWIIGSPVNLEVMSRPENSSKHKKCSIKRKELFKRFNNFINENDYLELGNKKGSS